LDRCDVLLAGNTDCYIAGNYLGGAYRNREHWKSSLLHWTRNELGEKLIRTLGELPFSIRYSPKRGQDLYVCHANPRNLEDSLDPTLTEVALRRYFNHLDAAACAFGHLHFPYRRKLGRLLIADVASAGLPRDGDLRAAYGLFTYTHRGWRVQIRRVRYPVRQATQAIAARQLPGGPLLIHKLVEARYRHHQALMEAARHHSGLPAAPALRPPPGYLPSAHPLPRNSYPGPTPEELDIEDTVSAEPLSAPALPYPPALVSTDLSPSAKANADAGEFTGSSPDESLSQDEV
jgi:hypothetical protein